MNFSESLYFSSNRLNRFLGQMADDAFRSLGLSSSYAFLLMIVNDEPGIQPMELSKRLQLKPSTITRLADKMEYRGYLKRSSEGRSTHIELTEKGVKIYPKLELAWRKLEQSYTDILGERYTDVLAEMAGKAAEKMEESN